MFARHFRFDNDSSNAFPLDVCHKKQRFCVKKRTASGELKGVSDVMQCCCRLRRKIVAQKKKKKRKITGGCGTRRSSPAVFSARFIN